MLRNLILFLMLSAISFQSLSITLLPGKNQAALHMAVYDSNQTYNHDALHFAGKPHTHDNANPQQIKLDYSAEARQHVAQDMNGATAVLLRHTEFKNTPITGCIPQATEPYLPEPFLHRSTPPPRT